MATSNPPSLRSIRDAYTALDLNPLKQTIEIILSDGKLQEEEIISELLEILPDKAEDLPAPEQLGLSVQTWLFLYWEIKEIHRNKDTPDEELYQDFPAKKASGALVQQDRLTSYISSAIPHPDQLLIKFNEKGIRIKQRLIAP